MLPTLSTIPAITCTEGPKRRVCVGDLKDGRVQQVLPQDRGVK